MKLNTENKLHSLKELYTITYRALPSIKIVKSARKSGLLSEALMERIMLAITEVNGCEICSYAHTKMALEAGLSNDEIQNMLGGSFSGAPADEMPAIMFAQHYADYRGRPTRDSWQRLIDVYGVPKARAILGASRLIMMGNAYGIPWSSFFNRFKGKGDTRSNPLYELGVIFSTFVYLPAGLIHVTLDKLSKRP